MEILVVKLNIFGFLLLYLFFEDKSQYKIASYSKLKRLLEFYINWNNLYNYFIFELDNFKIFVRDPFEIVMGTPLLRSVGL